MLPASLSGVVVFDFGASLLIRGHIKKIIAHRNRKLRANKAHVTLSLNILSSCISAGLLASSKKRDKKEKNLVTVMNYVMQIKWEYKLHLAPSVSNFWLGLVESCGTISDQVYS